MTKAEVLQELTKLYYICINNSSEKIEQEIAGVNISDDSWFRIAEVISTAEDVVIKEIKDE
tara:strand:- start:356 stop:538 length:183 start_codon:yes stop_codon:yes gene_type:complete